MRQKLRLLKADGYGFNLSAVLAVEMLTNFLAGRRHARWLGNEQGAIAAWDDIVLENYDRSLSHIQVKRQQGNFDDHPAIRGYKKQTKTTPPSNPTLVPLSALDETMRALADWFRTAKATSGLQRRFTIAVPSLQVLVKKEFPLKHFCNLCLECNNPQVTATALAIRAANDKSTSLIFDWLTTWCDYTDWEHILRTLRHVEVTEHALEAQLQARAIQELEEWFECPEDVLDSIRIYLEDKVTDLGGTTPRLLLNRLRSRLRSDAHTWTQYSAASTSTGWAIAGTTSDAHGHIDAPDQTVPVFWHSDSLRQKKLNIAMSYPKDGLRNAPLVGSLIRLAIHLKAPGHVSFNKCDVWTHGAAELLSNTLGIGPADLDHGNLHWIEQIDTLSPCDSRPLVSHADQRRETEELSQQMTSRVLVDLNARVCDAVALLPPGDLQQAVELKWNELLTEFNADQAYCENFLTSMLSPASEGLGHLAAMRLGPKTLPILTDGILMFLAVKVAMAPECGPDYMRSSDIRTICLRYWGGPAHGSKKARQIIDDDSDEDVEDLFGKETAPIILMPAVSASPTEINRTRLADDAALADCFAAPKRPLLTISRTRSFRRIIATGSVDKLKEFLRPELEDRSALRTNNIMNLPNGK